MVFFSGLTESLEDDELAAVVGHEMAHNTAAHISEHAAAKIVSLATERGRRKGWNEAYTYKGEQEADELGILYAALAGYDPYAASDLWEGRSDSGYEWFRTHPTSTERVERSKTIADKVSRYYQPGRLNPEAPTILKCNVLYCRRDAPSLKPGSGGGLIAAVEAVGSIRQQYEKVREEWKRQKIEIVRHDAQKAARMEGRTQNRVSYGRTEQISNSKDQSVEKEEEKSDRVQKKTGRESRNMKDSTKTVSHMGKASLPSPMATAMKAGLWMEKFMGREGCSWKMEIYMQPMAIWKVNSIIGDFKAAVLMW